VAELEAATIRADAVALIKRAKALIADANYPWHEDADEFLAMIKKEPTK
jgi:hypothetical protein